MNNIKDLLNRRAREFGVYKAALATRGLIPETKFIIFGLPRTGSHLLADLLTSHPQIFCDIEIWNRNKVDKLLLPKLHLRGHVAQGKQPVYGFMLKLAQLKYQQRNPKRFFEELSQQGWKVINLKRQDHFKQALSFLFAKYRDVWMSDNNVDWQQQDFRIDCAHLYKRIRNQDRASTRASDMLRDTPHLVVSYETDLLGQENWQATADRAFEFLAVPSVPVETELMRSSKDNPADYVKNFDEVVAFIGQTEYAHYLDEYI